jgi:hypothetical protein
MDSKWVGWSDMGWTWKQALERALKHSIDYNIRVKIIKGPYGWGYTPLYDGSKPERRTLT